MAVGRPNIKSGAIHATLQGQGRRRGQRALSSGSNTGNEVHTLPRASQDLVASFATSALSRNSHMSDKLKTQIWSGEYVSISSLLHDSSTQSYSVSVRPGSDDETPMFCVAPRARSSTVSFDQWLQGFEIYMSVFLLQPQHMSESQNMLMYIQTVRSLYEKGADWLTTGVGIGLLVPVDECIRESPSCHTQWGSLS